MAVYGFNDDKTKADITALVESDVVDIGSVDNLGADIRTGTGAHVSGSFNPRPALSSMNSNDEIEFMIVAYQGDSMYDYRKNFYFRARVSTVISGKVCFSGVMAITSDNTNYTIRSFSVTINGNSSSNTISLAIDTLNGSNASASDMKYRISARLIKCTA